MVIAPWRRLRRALRLYGIRGTARRALQAAHHPVVQPRHPDPFDLRYGTDTAGPSRLEGLTVKGENREHGVRYQASEPERVHGLLSGLEIDHGDFHFVDIGSGKGRVVLIASTFPFGKVVGVEFSIELSLVAQQNLRRFPSSERRTKAVEFVCMDATDYEFETVPLVLYMYNPFTRPIMTLLMRNLRQSLEEAPRCCIVLLVGDSSHGPTILDAGFRRVRDGVFSRG